MSGDHVCRAFPVTTTEPAPLVTDDDIHDIAEWLHPLWYESDHGRAQTWTTLLEQVRGALESRGPAMRDRWVADALDQLVSPDYVARAGMAPSIDAIRVLATQYRTGQHP